MSWTHRRFCAFDGRAVARFSYPPSRWLSKHLPPREAACDAFALDLCHSCSQRTCGGGSGSTYRRLVPLTGRAATCLLTPLLGGCLSTFSPTTTPPCVALTSTCILFAALRACWSRRSQVDVRARRALGGARRQAEFDAFGAGDAIVATSLRSILQRGSGWRCVPLNQLLRLPFRHVQLSQRRRCPQVAEPTS